MRNRDVRVFTDRGEWQGSFPHQEVRQGERPQDTHADIMRHGSLRFPPPERIFIRAGVHRDAALEATIFPSAGDVPTDGVQCGGKESMTTPRIFHSRWMKVALGDFLRLTIWGTPTTLPGFDRNTSNVHQRKIRWRHQKRLAGMCRLKQHQERGRNNRPSERSRIQMNGIAKECGVPRNMIDNIKSNLLLNI